MVIRKLPLYVVVTLALSACGDALHNDATSTPTVLSSAHEPLVTPSDSPRPKELDVEQWALARWSDDQDAFLMAGAAPKALDEAHTRLAAGAVSAASETSLDGWLFQAGNGRILRAGPEIEMAWINPNANHPLQPIGPRGDDALAFGGRAVMYEAGLILKTGGQSERDNPLSANASAYLIDASQGVNVRKLAAMSTPRAHHVSIALPNGQVLLVGELAQAGRSANAGIPAEIFDPQTQTFAAVPAMPRSLSSIKESWLLSDGRVRVQEPQIMVCMAIGCPPARPARALFFSPPYLFNRDGSPATRPRIHQAPVKTGFGLTERIVADPSVVSFALVGAMAFQGGVWAERRVSVPFQIVRPGVYELKIPSNPGELPPGRWRLFALNAQDTPSMAHELVIGSEGAPVLVSPGQERVLSGTPTHLPLQAHSPTGVPLKWSAQGLPPGLALDASRGVIEGISNRPGRYIVTVSVSADPFTVSTWFELVVREQRLVAQRPD